MTTKQCLKCGVVKPIDCFSPDRRRSDWTQGQCKECRATDEKRRRDATPVETKQAASRKHYNANRQAHRDYTLKWKRDNRDRVRGYELKRRYGLTLSDLQQMHAAQDGKCAICHKALKVRAHTDHCHKTGKVRGILCGGCNIVLGHLEKPGFLDSALDYLRKSA